MGKIWELQTKIWGKSGKISDILKFTHSQMVKNALKLSTLVGEKFEIYLSQMAKTQLNCPPWLEKLK